MLPAAMIRIVTVNLASSTEFWRKLSGWSVVSPPAITRTVFLGRPFTQVLPVPVFDSFHFVLRKIAVNGMKGVAEVRVPHVDPMTFV